MFLIFNLFVSFLLIGPNFGQIVQGAIINDLEAELKNNPDDPNSFSRSDRFVTNHINWKAIINFKEQTIEGVVDLSVEKLDKTNELVLDISELTINEIIDKDKNQKLKFKLSPVVKIFGSKLTVELFNKRNSNISISYKTSPNATALQWLKPEQTAGKKHPYLFSQGELIHTRSFIPLQDSPSVKATYEATIVVSRNLKALMSGRGNEGKGMLLKDGLTKEYRFIQNIPIPSYLISLAVGNLESKKIGPRSHVWSEPELIERSAYEFADTEKMLAIAESIMGPYIWGLYDLLILPPFYAYGGIENPCLTFVSPTLLAGDRSLAYVIAHEIAHSWTGNLVTNKNWDHFWLNEGFTTFVERKILGRLKGEAYREYMALNGLKELKNLVLNKGPNNPLTKLVPDLRGVDPDKIADNLLYEKGHTFLFYLEQKLGGPQIFEPFLRKYVKKFKYTSIQTNDFKAFLNQYFEEQKHILKNIDWNSWLYTTGMPPVIPNYDDSLAKKPRALAKRWINANGSNLAQFKPKDISSMNSEQNKDFLNQLSEADPSIRAFKVSALTQTYGLRSNNNSEIKTEWISLGLRAHWKGCVEDAVSFVTSMGRILYLEPVYKALYDWKNTRKLAIRTFQNNEYQYMIAAVKSLSKVLHVDDLD